MLLELVAIIKKKRLSECVEKREEGIPYPRIRSRVA
jgi:hypothetical protein